ncbi:MAG: hypothetical protein A2X77_03180 [Gammaproteobacteria bacterium GWE2_42_36]|nr:MAG: hypothetical protein A2X77_03180 [Gammaproteobacteria bacterium GWE2_42_36]HCU04824.1 hypothetical protein [Coxiellaceae bacterium]
MTKKNINRLFYAFITFHLFCWTILPTFLRYTLPLDAMEGTTWGRQLFWGYDKNPFLNAWLTELAVFLGGKSGWLIYAFGQLCVIACFWAVYQLGKKMLSPLYALIAVLLLETMSNYNIDAIDFNDNTLLLAFWALIIYFFYKALQSQKIKNWVAVGVFSGLAMMAKYFIVMLFIPMALFLIINPIARQSFKQRGLYLASLIFIFIILPHALWLSTHHFITLTYAFARTQHPANWVMHIKYPLHFTLSYLGASIPPLMLFFALKIGCHTKTSNLVERKILPPFQWQFLIYLGVAPFLCVILLSFLTGMALHVGWGQPLLSLGGLVLLARVQPAVTQKQWKRFLAIFYSVFFALLIGYAISLMNAGDSASANYPGPIIANQLTQQWHDRYHTTLTYVVGPRFDAGAVSFYSTDRPAVYMDADPLSSFWIDEKTLSKKGALFLWLGSLHDEPADWARRFPHLIDPQTLFIPWMRDKKTKPLQLSIAFLSPQDRLKIVNHDRPKK